MTAATSRSNHDLRHRRRVVSLIVVCGLAGSLMAWQWNQSVLARYDEERFVSQAEARVDGVLQQVQVHANALRAASGLFNARPETRPMEFQRFYAALIRQAHYPALVGMSQATWMHVSQWPHLQAVARADASDHPDAIMREALGRLELWPRSDNDTVMPTMMVEPSINTSRDGLATLGYDLSADPERRQTALQARDSGDILLTPPFNMNLSQPGVNAVSLRAPVYRAGSVLDSDEQRRVAFTGTVSAVLRLSTLLGPSPGGDGGMTLTVDDLGWPGLPRPARRLTAPQTPTAPEAKSGWWSDAVHHRVVERTVAGRLWRFELTQPYAPAWRRDMPLWMLSASLLITAIAAAITHILMRQQARAAWMGRQLEEESVRHAHTLRKVLDSTSDAIVSFDAGSRVVEANLAASELFGRDREALLGRTLSELTEGIRPRTEQDAATADGRIDAQARHADGHWRAVSALCSPFGDDGLTLSLTDVSERREALERAHHFEQMSQAILDCSPYSVMVTGLDGRITSVNPATEVLLGCPREQLIGRPVLSLHDREEIDRRAQRLCKDSGQAVAADADLFHREREFYGKDTAEWVYLRADGSSLVAAVSVALLLDRNGRHQGSVRVSADITERRRNAEHMRYLAEHDTLTGLRNRGSLQNQLDAAVARIATESPTNPLALLFLDLDRFKQINDSLGHAVGDALISTVAQRLKTAVRASDVVARMGGDEFVVMLPGIGSLEEAERFAGKLLHLLGAPYHVVGGHELHVSASIGVALCPQHGTDSATLMRLADGAMYRAKQSGRATWRLAEADVDTHSPHRLWLQSSLHHALERGEFELHYQPQFDMRSGALCGAEALLRWCHDGRYVSPAEFVPLAEEWGLIVPIGRWVLQQACRQAQAWRQLGTPLRIGVNLSPLQIEHDDVLASVQSALGASGLPAQWLELEITEGAVVRDPATTAELLRQLRHLGMHVAIDDFGVGYSSLAYLQDFPIDRIKIDRAFMRGMQPPPVGDDGRLVAALIAMGRTLGLRVTAEGVETEAQADFLRQAGCHEVQGFLYGRPCDAAAFEAQWLQAAVPA